MEGEWSRKRRH